jgi:nitric oxide reductase subunit B
MSIRRLWIGFAAVVVIEHGYWYARSPEFLQTGVIETFRWLRVIGDTVFATGAIALAAFVIGLRTGGSTRNERFRVPAGQPVSTR